jgi:transcription elongation GreA/GreB family factor
MNKSDILQLIIQQLSHDLSVQFNAALAAHEASTHEENIPDNKYETLALEASYLAQGQANRAQDLRRALECYKQLELKTFDDSTAIGLTALITLESGNGSPRTVFIGPLEGGLKIPYEQQEIVVITPASPLGRKLCGKLTGETVTAGIGKDRTELEIVEVC